MGTRFEVVLFAGADLHVADLRAAGEAAVDEITYWHARLNRFAPDSFVSHLVRSDGDGVRLDREMYDLFADAEAVRRASAGAFDVTAGDGHLIDLDRDARTLTMRGGGMMLDLGGIAKGHALDCAAARLADAGVQQALIHGGTSSVIAMGRPPGSAGWRVAVGPGDDDVVVLVDTALSLSDLAGQVDATGLGHIVDPRRRDGRMSPGQPRDRVAVIGPSARLADAWSTALTVLGHEPDTFPDEYEARFLSNHSGAHADVHTEV
jgi:thiamine biosynthesis lipoprotein